MLRFVLGLAGTGKTTNLMEKMRACAQNGDRLIYLVPEQYSFEAEREIHRRLGGRLALSVEVFSFTRLCDSVFRAYGGLAGVSLSKTAKYLLMSIAVDEVKEKLSLYRKSSSNTAFLETLVQTCGEFKTAGVTCGALASFADTCGDAGLRNKLGELSVIYTAYQSLIERGYSDPDDDLIRACVLLENNSFFENAAVFVDGFTTFMAAEFELLGHVIAQSRDVCFAFTAESVFDNQRGMGVFSAAKSAMNRLSRLAERNGVSLAESEILAETLRFKKPELEHIARHFMRPAPPEYAGDYTGALTVLAAADAYDELDAVAAVVAGLARDENLRYREIAVVAREPSSYERAIEDAFSRHGVPYFLSMAEDAENKPLAACILSALDAARSGFDTAHALLFAKSPLLGLDPEEIALLENYCYCWSVRGALWREDFTNNPRGMAGPPTQADIDLLARINSARKAVIEPLINLRGALKDPNGRSFAAAVFGLLEEIGAAENLLKYAATLPQSEAFLAEAAQLWDVTVDILDIFGVVLGSRKMAAARLCELLRLALASAEVSSPPQTLDQVLVGGADRIRPAAMRAVFVIGANEGVFPARFSVSGVFSDEERGKLIDAGLEISAPSLQKSVLEKYFAYFALTLPSERLHVSFPRSDLRGRELSPSVIIEQLTELFPGLTAPEPDALDRISTAGSAFGALSRGFSDSGVFAATLREYFSRGGQARALAKMRCAAEKKPHGLTDENTARELFGRFMRLSPSRVERFYRCPFSYFVSDGLDIRSRNKVGFTGLESGSVIHHVLQVMVARHGGKGLNALAGRQMTAEISGIIHEYLAERVGNADKLPSRLKFLFGRLAGSLSRLLARLGEEFAQSEFEPAAFELPIKTGGEIEPLRLETPDGATVVVEGVVDRVDVMNKSGKRYVRVVDYKSGVKSFALHDVLYGLNMQMLLYLFTIAENGAGELAGAVPAGVLYMPARERYMSAARDADGETVRKTRERELRMNGLLLEDEEVLRGMERDIAGVYIPAKLDKNGRLDAASSVAGSAELGRLARKVKEQVADMARSLGKGAVEACPVEADGARSCEYCDYREVCGFEPGDAVRRIVKLDRDEFFKLIEEE